MEKELRNGNVPILIFAEKQLPLYGGSVAEKKLPLYAYNVIHYRY